MTGRVLVAAALVVALAAALGGLQGRFDGTDARRGVARVLAHRATLGGPSVLEALEALGEGAPRCDGEVVNRLLGDVRVRCMTARGAGTVYGFRSLLDGERAPKAESLAARSLLENLAAAAGAGARTGG